MKAALHPISTAACAPWPQWGIVVALVLALTAGGSCLRADETTRRLQEELRKRNLYFGDVDGRLTAQLSTALHRYQERKGFPSTGAADTDTLFSLNIARLGDTPPPLVAAAPSASAVPPPLGGWGGIAAWPDVTVLRSDEARSMPVAGTGEGSSAGEEAGSDTPAATPAPPPLAAESRRRPTDEEVSDFVRHYLDAGQNNHEETELAFYDEHVAFYDEGNVDHTYLARAVNRYDHRWPERHFVVIGPVTVFPSPDGSPDRFVVNFRMSFNVKNSRYTVAGKTDNTWTVSGHDPGTWKIISMKEQRVREK